MKGVESITVRVLTDGGGWTPFCTFYWSEATGLRCTRKHVMEELAANGVAVPPAGRKVYPADGARFFAGLPFRFSGSYMSAGPPQPVPPAEVQKRVLRLRRYGGDSFRS